MRIGELAALVGVSTRTVRHYHHLGLLPEPKRLANGYREYRLKDAVLLARVRRLAELGLALDEIRDVLADERGRELREVLTELDVDLARQQQAITTRRARLAALLDDPELGADSPVSPEMADVLRGLPGAGAGADGSRFAEHDRELLAFVDTVAGPASGFADMLRPLIAHGAELYARLDEIADAAPDDPRVTETAETFAALLPDELATAMAAQNPDAAWLDDMPAAQAEVFRATITMLKDRTC